MRVVFFGTPEFAVPSLEALAAEADLRPQLVVSQPSRPVGRRSKLVAPAVVVAAERLGLPTVQVESVRDKKFLSDLETLEPDIAVVVAFGQIFRRRLLELPRLGCVNLHGSLLPRWRGAAPIQAALAAGDAETGVTTQQMERGLDSGPVLLRAATPIEPDETAPELAVRLAALGAPLVVDTLRRLDAGTLLPEAQDEPLVTYAPRLGRDDAIVDWSLGAQAIYDRWRGYFPWPGASTTLRGEPLKLLELRPEPRAGSEGSPQRNAPAPGTVSVDDDGALRAWCGGGTLLRLETVQRPSRKRVTGAELARAESLDARDRLGDSAAGGSPAGETRS